MTKFILPFLFLILALDSYSQQNKNLILAKVKLSYIQKPINNKDTIPAPGPRLLTVSIDSEVYHFTDAEFTVILKRGKSNIYMNSGKGKEIIMDNVASRAQPGDMVIIEIKKMNIATPNVIMKPSNGFFRIYLK